MAGEEREIAAHDHFGIPCGRVGHRPRDRGGPLVLLDAILKTPANPPIEAIMDHPVFRALDHVAIVVPDTEEALKVWRDGVGLSVLYSEVVNEGALRLTHLDLGNTHLQLVQPLKPDHPLQAWLAKNGAGLHHLCLRVDDVGAAFVELPKRGLAVAAAPHQGTQGKRAFFLDKGATQDVQLEVTGK